VTSKPIMLATVMLLGALSLGFQETPQKADNESKSAKIGDVAWIAGHWGTEMDGDQLDEHWSKPDGDCMMGMFRWMKDDKVWIYELLTIRQEKGTLVLRFRHFDGDLTSWEPKDEPLTYWLSSITKSEVVFENPKSEKARLFAFRLDDANAMTVRVGALREGKIEVREFHYERK